MSSDFSEAEFVTRQFVIEGDFSHIEEHDTGLINSTYVAHFTSPEESSRYIIQRINSHVFPDPLLVMRNVELVIDHIVATTESPQLTLYRTANDLAYYEAEDGGVWRCYSFIEGCVTYDIVETPEQAYEAAYAFGEFQNKLSDLSLDEIAETIPDFHHTPKRYAALLDAVENDSQGRLSKVSEELDLIKNREQILSRLIDLRDSGALPVRITHNDTKFNNVMINPQSGKAVCVIDLDTVMPGLSLYDFGDLVRTSVNPSGEDLIDGVDVRIPIYQSIVDGYLTACECLSDEEIENLVFSAKLITLELAIRFLTDYLDGDLYFKTEYPEQNLQRARVQLKLVETLESCEDEMVSYVRNWVAK